MSELQLKEAIRKTERYIQHNGKIHFPGNVLLMYLSNTNQINVAINRCGINSKTNHGVVVFSNNADVEFLVSEEFIKLAGRLIPYDLSEKDFEVFSNMAKVDTTI